VDVSCVVMRVVKSVMISMSSSLGDISIRCMYFVHPEISAAVLVMISSKITSGPEVVGLVVVVLVVVAAVAVTVVVVVGGIWHGVGVMHWVRSWKLLYAEPG